MIEIVKNYERVLSNIDRIIDMSPYKTSYIIDALGISAAMYHKKKREKNFALNDMIKLAEIFDTEEMEDKLLGMHAEQVEKEGAEFVRYQTKSELV